LVPGLRLLLSSTTQDSLRIEICRCDRGLALALNGVLGATVSRVRESQNFGSNCNGSQKEAGVRLCRNPVCSVFRPGADPAHEEKARDQSHGESLLSLWCPTSAIIPRQRRYSERPCSQSSGGIAWQKNL